MKLTASKLQLYDMPGKGAAANDISRAVTSATKQAIKKIGRRYYEKTAVAAISEALELFVYPVLNAHRKLGAADTEPRAVAKSEVVNRVSKRYNLGQWENETVYYAL